MNRAPWLPSSVLPRGRNIRLTDDLERATHGRVAVVHEWIEARAGSEQVFEALAGVFPTADLYALTREPTVALDVAGREIHTTMLDRPVLRRRRALTLPVMPLAWHLLDAPDYDLVITSSHAYARWFPPARAALHLSYVHAPARYLWMPELDRRTLRFPRAAKYAGAPLRLLDRRSAAWTDSFAANSRAVALRILDYYGVHARVIHPPVDVTRFAPMAPDRPRSYVLAVSRFIPYKRLDLTIEACARAGMPLVVAGYGPLENDLRRRATGTDTQFVIKPDNSTIADLYARALVLVFPGEEDFGIVPVEAQASGTPVLALARGGTLDTVRDGVTGALVSDQTVEAFAESLRWTDWESFDRGAIRQHAEHFGFERFRREVLAWIEAARA